MSGLFRYTLTEHPRWVFDGDPHYEHAVSVHGLARSGEVQRVRNVGGLVFDDFKEACRRKEWENYGHGESLRPMAVRMHVRKPGSFLGDFLESKVHGLRIYYSPRDEAMNSRPPFSPPEAAE